MSDRTRRDDGQQVANPNSASGPFDMHGNKIIDLGAGTNPTDATNLGEVQTLDAAVLASAESHADNGDVNTLATGEAYTDASSATRVPDTRTLTGTAPLTIDGDNAAHDLSANRTVAIVAATPSVAGVAGVTGSMSSASKTKLDALPLFASPITLVNVVSAAGGGSFTTAVRFAPLAVCFCTGMRMNLPAFAAQKTLRIKLWQYAGSVLIESIDVVIPIQAAQIVIVNFLSAHALTPGLYYMVSVWETGGTQYFNATLGSGHVAPTRPFTSGLLLWDSWSFYHAGDAFPDTNDDPAELHAFEPVLTL